MFHTSRSIGLLLFITVLSCLPSLASAAIITFDYTAEGSGASAGATVTGQFGWDTSVADTNPGSPLGGVYPNAGFWSGMVSGGPQDGGSVNLAGLDTTVFNDVMTSLDDVVSMLGPSFNSQITLAANSPATLADDSLPTTLTLADFDLQAEVQIANVDVGLPGLDTQIYNFTSITLIPLPAAVWLFGGGLIGLLGITRRKVNK